MPTARPWKLKHLRANIPLRWVLTVPFVVSTLGVGVLVGQVTYRSRQVAMENLGYQLVEAHHERVMQALKHYLKTAPLVNRLNVDAVHQGQLDPNRVSALEASLFRQINQFEQVSAILFVSPQGRLRFVERFPQFYLGAADPARPDRIQIYELNHQGQPSKRVQVVNGLDVRRDRPFYARAVASGRLVWSDIFPYGNTNTLTLSASQPAYDPQTQQLVGVFAVHLRLDYLSEFLRQLAISNAGQVLIVDQAGKMVATSTRETLFVAGDSANPRDKGRPLRIDESQDALTRAIAPALQRYSTLTRPQTTSQTLPFSHQGTPYLVTITPFQELSGLDWRIITVIPKAHFIGPIEHSTAETLLISLLTVGGTLTLGLLAANQLTSRFAQLDRVSKALAAGNLNQQLPTDSPIAELNSLSSTFNQMADQLWQSFNRITDALEASEAKFTTIFRTSPDPVAIANLPECRLLEVNDSLLSFFGYSRQEMLGQTALDLHLWHDASQHAEYCALLEKDSSVRNLEVQVQTKSGDVKTVLLSSEVRTLEGQACVIVMLRDISDRKAAELALQQSEARYRAVVDSQTESICRALPDTTVTFVNDAYCRYSNVRPEEVLGKPFIADVHPDDRAFVLQHLHSATPENPTLFSENRIIRNGQTVWMQWINQVFFDQQGRATEIQSVGRDITALKQAEAALKRSEENLLKAQKIARLGSWEFDVATKKITWSEALFDIFGLPPDQVELSYDEVMQKLPPSDRHQLAQAVEQAIAQGTSYEIEHAIYYADGTTRYVLSRGQAVLNLQMQVVKLVGTALDITERKQAEIELIKSKTLQRAILDAIPDLMIRMHRDGTYLEIKHATAFRSVLPNLVVGENVRNVLPPEEAQKRLAITELALQTGDLQVYEFSLQWEDRESWQEARVIPLTQEEVLILVRDLTARKQAENALRQSEERFRQLAEAVQEGFFVFETATSQYSYLNPACIALTGVPLPPCQDDPPFVQGMMHWWNRIHPDDRDRIKAALMQEQQGQQFDQEYRFLYSDGEVRWLRSKAFPLRDETGTVVRIVGTVDDVTERRSFEEALQQSEEKFRRTFDDAPIGASLVSATGQFLRVNARYCELLGYTEAELLSMSFQDITHPNDLLADLEGFHQMVAGEISAFQMEKRYLTKQGEVVPVLLNSAPIRDPDGQLLYVLGHVQDIRDRLRVERMKDEFISVISHELRTPLTAIRGALGLLGSGVYRNRPEKANHMLQIAINSSERLVRLVNEILTFERLKSDKAPLLMERCQAEYLMQQAVDSVQAIADQAKIALIVTPMPAVLWGNPDAIIQCLTNLLSNAIKFSHPGNTVWLSAALCPPPAATTSSLQFSIQDQGRGIPDDKLELIFDQFQQVDVSDSRTKGGTGLGLAICKQIVQQHKGKIWVESVLGKGSTFHFTVPLADKSHE